MNKTYERILEDIKAIRIYSTHCHHREDSFYSHMSLDKILSNSYVTFTQPLAARNHDERALFLERNRYNTYLLWLEKAIRELYDIPERITANNWDEISQKITSAYENNSERHLDILRNHCRYNRVVQDAFWKPGSDLGHPDLFAPAYRINMFTYALDENPHDHDNVCLYEQCSRKSPPGDLEEFIVWMEEQITKKVNSGCSALKSALAYGRDLHYQPQDRDHIAKLYRMDKRLLTGKDRHDFSDYVIDAACKIAAKLDIPFQHHTGLGAIDRTNAMQLRELIERNPDTKFVLFHGSYPWLEDVYALVHKYPNTYADLCWLPIISTSASQRMILELLEVGQTHRIHWGCDTWTSEESYGAVLAIEHALANVLSAQVDQGFYTHEDAVFIARRILRDNTKELYRI
ncbi:amidohydrolase family protein [Pseudobacteroides cellulosolvens]|uniref:Amidohydrolase 2 n=1 Tax=Pseudobacteroides cellulosolvens ATCC 35603 = DSM 2933 TaxID=398512 RepID=A0A0L6JT42_9FIRM|nr:amidohydrolase family protein [Pseudobacteroides cellulosolvens]KNY28855.1 amidohydrolase 2 [Pseudobacteroides cellulosolvens ATCC 35603 = DSM 2933]